MYNTMGDSFFLGPGETKFIVLDLETTGFDPRRDEIIEVGLVLLEGDEVKKTYQSLVRPHRRLPVSIRRLTGLTDEELGRSPEITEVLPEIISFIADLPIIGHNITFDLGFLEAAAGALKNASYDTFELSQILMPDAASYRLGALCAAAGFPHAGEHRALNDALATAELFSYLAKTIMSFDALTLFRLGALLKSAGSQWASYFFGAARRIAADQTNQKTTSFGGTPFALLSLPEPCMFHEGTGLEDEMSPDQCAGFFKPQGQMSKFLSGYEHRKQQEEMARAVSRAFSTGKHLLIDAGTGVGKSAAYLIPLLNRALGTRQRGVVATHTLNLQEQLWKKDIPFLKEVLPFSFRAAVVKGRQNYLCLRRWLAGVESEGWSSDEAFFLARVMVWLTRTVSGDRSEINIMPRDNEPWFKLCAESEACIGSNCRWFSRGCFVARARKAAQEANLIVTNHALLITDMDVENKLLPTYGALVIDEAHHLENVATEQLGRCVSQATIRRWLWAVNKKLSEIIPVLSRQYDDLDWDTALSETKDMFEDVREASQALFKALQCLFKRRGKGGKSVEYGFNTMRMKSARDIESFSSVAIEHANFEIKAGLLLRRIKKIINALQSLTGCDPVLEDNHAPDLLNMLNAGEALIADIDFIINMRDPEYVCWIEMVGEGENQCSQLRAAPVEVGESLYRCLFENRKEAVIFTSATLAVEGSFQYFLERTGLNRLDEDQMEKICVDSPFDYDSQALLCLVKDLPVQGKSPEENYYRLLTDALKKLVCVAQGRTLVLFTSHKVLGEAYRRLKPACEEMDILLLGHNFDGSRSRLVESFRSNERAVLFGATSFWEGVDIPGEALSCVVIVKLPFISPGVPVTEARLERLAADGKDGFLSYSLPTAVIRFKQGFGRLIRSMHDRGVVVVLDNRVFNRRYGMFFINSLPISNVFASDFQSVLRRVDEWLGNKNCTTTPFHGTFD